MNSPEVSKRKTALQPTSRHIDAAREHVGPGQDLPINRRSFCNGLLLSSAGLVLAARTSVGETLTQQDSMLAYPPLKIEGAEKLMPGLSLYFNYPTRTDPAVLVRLPEGQYVAYNRKCSHAGCSIEYDAARGCLKCPCHQGAYDARIGYVIFGPPPRPLDQIVLQMRAGGQVWANGKVVGRSVDMIARKA